MRSHFDYKDSKNFETTTPILIIFFQSGITLVLLVVLEYE